MLVLCFFIFGCTDVLNNPFGIPGNESGGDTKLYGSTNNGISNLAVNGVTAAGTSPAYSSGISNTLDRATISFNKPNAATALIKNSGGATIADFNNPEQNVCAAQNIPFAIGSNLFTISITSESGRAASYSLAVSRGSQPVASITLSPKTLNAGAIGSLDYAVLPVNATDKTVTWFSDNTAAVMVHPVTGLITAVARGTALITATAVDGSGKSGSATVTVESTDKAVLKLTVNGAEASGSSPAYSAVVANTVEKAIISFGKSGSATALLKNSGGATIADFSNPGQTVCSAPDIPLVIGANLFFITVTSESGDSASYTLTINRGSQFVTSITLSPKTLSTGSFGTLDYTVLPATATNKNAVWSSDNTAVAAVDANTGLITAVARGTALITATAADGSGVKGTATVTVADGPGEGTQPNLSTDTGISGLSVNGAAAAGSPPAYSAGLLNSVDKATISFNKAPLATALLKNSGGATVAIFSNPGQNACLSGNIPFAVGVNIFTITVTSESGSAASYSLTVTRASQPVTSITLSPKALNAGATGSLAYSVLPANATNQTVTWSSNNTAVAAVNATTGLITAKTRGTATISAAAADGSNVKGSATVTVKSTDNAISGLSVGGQTVSGASPYSASVANTVDKATISFNKPLGATALLKNSSGATIATFSNTEQSACSAANTPFAVESNLFTITITSESGAGASYTLTVIRAKQLVTSITLSPKTLITGAVSSLDYTVLPANATNQTVTWSSNNTAAVTVNAVTGLITAVANGTAIITATAADGSGKSGSATVTVNEYAGLQLNRYDLENDMYLNHEGIPSGVPDYIGWKKKPGSTYGNKIPEDWNAALPWGQVYADETLRDPDKQFPLVRVHLKDIQLFIYYGDGNWKLITELTNPGGAAYVESFAGDENKKADIVKESGGGVSVQAGSGFNFHFWGNRGVVEDRNIKGVFVVCKARLLGTENYDKPSKYLLCMGGDYWRNMTATFKSDYSNNNDIAIGRFRYITPEWQYFFMHTFTKQEVKNIKFPGEQ